MRRLQMVLGVVLAVGAFAAVLFVGQMNQPPLYEAVVVMVRVPAFTALSSEMVQFDSQSMSPAVAAKYVLAGEWEQLLAAGAVAVENLYPGQPLLREQVASGADAEGLSRLAVALTDPDRVIVSFPVNPDALPAVVPGDVVALFFAAGNVGAQSLVTYTLEGPTPTPTPRALPGSEGADAGEQVTVTTELRMPVAKWIANGVVYRLNRERRENPNYGAPGMENEPRYIEGELKSLDVVVSAADAEWVAFALAHGEVQMAVLPAINRPDVETGTLPPEAGVTWSDFEQRFFQEREREREE